MEIPSELGVRDSEQMPDITPPDAYVSTLLSVVQPLEEELALGFATEEEIVECWRIVSGILENDFSSSNLTYSARSQGGDLSLGTFNELRTSIADAMLQLYPYVVGSEGPTAAVKALRDRHGI